MKQFKSIDKDSNGELSKEELISGYMQLYGFDKEHASTTVEDIFKQVDSNNSGKIDFTEFVVAAINKDKLLSK